MRISDANLFTFGLREFLNDNQLKEVSFTWHEDIMSKGLVVGFYNKDRPKIAPKLVRFDRAAYICEENYIFDFLHEVKEALKSLTNPLWRKFDLGYVPPWQKRREILRRQFKCQQSNNNGLKKGISLNPV
jgi:hypothetical protein